MMRKFATVILIAALLAFGLRGLLVQGWCCKEIREADNYEYDGCGNDTRAQDKQENPYCGGTAGDCTKYVPAYTAYANGSDDKAVDVMNNVPRDYLFYLCGHGNKGVLACADVTFIIDQTCGNPLCGWCASGTLLGSKDWTKCLIAVFQTCYSAAGGTHGNIASSCGAQARLGFTETVNGGSPSSKFGKYLWEALCQGKRPDPDGDKDCTPVNISSAADYARDMVNTIFGDYHGYDSRSVQGNSNEVAIDCGDD